MPKLSFTRRMVNPAKRKKFTRRKRAGRRHHKTNPLGGGVLYLMSNGRKHKRSKKHRNPGFFKARKRRSRKNPSLKFSRRSRRRNPLSVGGYSLTQIATLGLSAGAGGVLSRSIPSFLLKEKNTGIWGYLANFAVAIGGGILVGKYVDKEAGTGFIAGGVAVSAWRIYTEQISKASPNNSGMGDLEVGLGDMGYFQPTPAPISQDQGGPYQQASLPAATAQAAVAAAAAAGAPQRYQSRY